MTLFFHQTTSIRHAITTSLLIAPLFTPTLGTKTRADAEEQLKLLK